MANQADIHKSSNLMIQSDGALTLYKCVMFEGGAFKPWDTSLLANQDLFCGVVIGVDRDFTRLANDGVFPIDLADGTWYCDSMGDLVNSLPMGSFNHKVGEVSNGYMILNRKLIDASVSTDIVDTLAGNEPDKAPSVRAVNEGFDVLAFTNCC